MPLPAKNTWKKGRGKLGVLEPLLGSWRAEADSPMGRVECTRTFSKILGGNWVSLEAEWKFGGKSYLEHAIYGVDRDRKLSFWSFTSDGKNSFGTLTDAPDIHPQAIAFEAQMPAGTARMTYWPDADGRVNWVVESKTKKGWNRFTHHVYSKT